MKKLLALGLVIFLLVTACGNSIGMKENNQDQGIEITVYKTPN